MSCPLSRSLCRAASLYTSRVASCVVVYRFLSENRPADYDADESWEDIDTLTLAEAAEVGFRERAAVRPGVAPSYYGTSDDLPLCVHQLGAAREALLAAPGCGRLLDLNIEPSYYFDPDVVSYSADFAAAASCAGLSAVPVTTCPVATSSTSPAPTTSGPVSEELPTWSTIVVAPNASSGSSSVGAASRQTATSAIGAPCLISSATSVPTSVPKRGPAGQLRPEWHSSRPSGDPVLQTSPSGDSTLE